MQVGLRSCAHDSRDRYRLRQLTWRCDTRTSSSRLPRDSHSIESSSTSLHNSAKCIAAKRVVVQKRKDHMHAHVTTSSDLARGKQRERGMAGLIRENDQIIAGQYRLRSLIQNPFSTSSASKSSCTTASADMGKRLEQDGHISFLRCARAASQADCWSPQRC